MVIMTKEWFDMNWTTFAATIWVIIGIGIYFIRENALNRRLSKTLSKELGRILEGGRTQEEKQKGIQCFMNVDLPIVLTNFFCYQMEYYDTLYKHILRLDEEIRKIDPKYSIKEYGIKKQNLYFLYLNCFHLFEEEEGGINKVKEFREILVSMKQTVNHPSIKENKDLFINGWFQNKNPFTLIEWVKMVYFEQLHLKLFLEDLYFQLRYYKYESHSENANMKEIIKQVDEDCSILSQFLTILEKAY